MKKSKYIKKILATGLAMSMLLSGCGIITMQKANQENAEEILDVLSDVAKEFDEQSTKIKRYDSSSSKDSSRASSRNDMNSSSEDDASDDNKNPDEYVSFEKRYDVKEGEYKLLEDSGAFIYGNMMVEIPDEWAGKVYVTGFDRGFSFHEAKSHEYDGSGYMFGFFESDNNVMNYSGEYMYAYNPNCTYNISTPSDVPYPYDVKDIAEAYSYAIGFEEQVIKSLRINDSSTKYDGREHMFPMSEYKPLDEDCLRELTDETADYAIGEIYARHGAVFDDPYMQNYFDKYSWYQNRGVGREDVSLSPVEKKNIELIENEMSGRKTYNPYPIEHTMGDITSEVLNSNFQAVDIQVDFVNRKGKRVANIIIDGDVWTSDYAGVKFENPYEDKYFITSIEPYEGTAEIALIDLGKNGDSVTYYFKIDDKKKLKCIGGISGIPFKGFDGYGYGFSNYGGLMAYHKSDILGGIEYYTYCWYNSGDMKIQENDASGYYAVLPMPLLETLEDIEYYSDYNFGLTETLKKGSRISVTAVDEYGTLRVHVKDTGDDLIVKLTDDIKNHPEKYFKKY